MWGLKGCCTTQSMNGWVKILCIAKNIFRSKRQEKRVIKIIVCRQRFRHENVKFLAVYMNPK